MHYKTKYLSFIFFSLFALSHFSVYAQTKRQLQLEERRRELQQEIRQITNLLFAGKKEEELQNKIFQEHSMLGKKWTPPYVFV